MNGVVNAPEAVSKRKHIPDHPLFLTVRNYLCLRSESKTCQDGEDWASDRKSAKSEAEARVRKLSLQSTIAAGETDKIGQDTRRAVMCAKT